MQSVINNKYFLTGILQSNSEQDVVLCRRTSTDLEAFQKYIINIYKDRTIIKDILPDLAELMQKYNSQYIEHFVDGSKLHVVFRHSIPETRLTIGKALNLKDRMEISNNLFLCILKLNDMPLSLVYKLLNRSNVIIAHDKSVYFSNVFYFSDNSKNISRACIVERAGLILKEIFKGMPKLPQVLADFINNCCRQKYDSIANAYLHFKSIQSEFEQVEYNFKKGKKLYGLAMIPFGSSIIEKTSAFKKNGKLVIALVCSCFLLTIGTLWVYDTFFKKAVPVSEYVDIQIPEPVKQAKEIEPTPAPAEPAATEPEFSVYTVKKGDWLAKISKEFYGDSAYYYVIAEYNNLENPNILEVGQTLKLPAIDVNNQ